MKKMKLLTLAFILPFFFTCGEKNPIEVELFKLKAPGESPLIQRENLVQNGDFSVGYFNGKIRSTQVTLNWQAYTGKDFLCYRVYRNGSKIRDITSADNTIFTDTTLIQNTYYFYQIATLNQQGLYQTDTIRIKTPMFLPPSQLNYKIIDSTSLKLTWKNRAESATSFRILRKLQNEPSSMYQVVGTSRDTFFVDHNLENHQWYHYQVIAYNQWEETDPSDPYLIYVNYVMNPPFLSSVTQVPLTRSVLLQWVDNSNAEDGFRIYRKEGAGNFTMVGSVAGDVTEFTDNDTTNSLQVGHTYYYYVTAFNQWEETGPSNILNITITAPPDYVEIGNGTYAWSYPFNTYYHDARTQTLYLQSEIGGPITIRKIGLYVTQTPGQIMNNFTIRMKHTTQNSYASGSFDNSGYSICFIGNLEVATTGWIEIPLDTPFHYNGTDNLIIDISFDNTSWSSAGKCYATYTGDYRSICQRSDSGLGDPLTWSTGTLYRYVPNIRLYKSAK